MPGDTQNREAHWGKPLHIHDDCIETEHCLGCYGLKIDKNCFEVFKTVQEDNLPEGKDRTG